MDGLRCIGRVDIALDSSFSDVVLLPSARSWNNYNTSLFLLTNHGKLQFLDSSFIFSSMSHQERTTVVSAVEFPTIFPSLNPSIMASKLSKLPIGGCSSKVAFLLSLDLYYVPYGDDNFAVLILIYAYAVS